MCIFNISNEWNDWSQHEPRLNCYFYFDELLSTKKPILTLSSQLVRYTLDTFVCNYELCNKRCEVLLWPGWCGGPPPRWCWAGSAGAAPPRGWAAGAPGCSGLQSHLLRANVVIKAKISGQVDSWQRRGYRTEVGTFYYLFYTSTRTLLPMQFFGICTIFESRLNKKLRPEIRVRIRISLKAGSEHGVTSFGSALLLKYEGIRTTAYYPWRNIKILIKL